MSVLGKTKEEVVVPTWKKMIIPWYIIFSMIFIIVTLYYYFVSFVYQSWVVDGGQQWLETWQWQWYRLAIEELTQKVTEKCEPVAITINEKQVDIINVACLQDQAPAPQAAIESDAPIIGE